MLGLCCTQASSSCCQQGLLIVVVCELLIAEVLLLWSGSGAQVHGFSCYTAYGILLDQGSNQCPLHCKVYSSGPTGPPGKSLAAAAAAKSLQSCPTLCDPIDGSPPGSPVPGIPQARTLEWVAISFSNAWKWKVKVKSLSRVRLLATSWTTAYQAPPSMGFSRQEYWSGVPLPSP